MKPPPQPAALSSSPFSWFNIAVALVACALGAWTGSLRRGQTPVAPALAPVADVAPPEPPVEPAPPISPTAPHLVWPALENQDWRQYKANLQALGCPEDVVADILRGQILALYQAKANAIFDPLARYWSHSKELKQQDDAIQAIRQERDALLASLGLESPCSPADNGLSPEKQRYVAEALKQYPKLQLSPGASPEQVAQEAENRRGRLAYLAQYLTPDELLTYRITSDGNADSIGMYMRDLDLQEDEFRKVFSALDGEELHRTNGFFRTDLEDKVRQSLGDDRYSEYRQAMAPENLLFNNFVKSLGLSSDQIARLQELRRSDTLSLADYRQAAAAIIQDPNALRRYFDDAHLFKGASALRRSGQ